MDNFRLDITSEGTATLKAAMHIAFSHHKAGATHYMLWQEKGLVFLWTKPASQMQVGAPEAVAFPFKMDADGAADFALRWLAEADYGREPDHDGDNGKGWRLYNEAWGHVGTFWQAIIAVQPAWAMYGK